MSPRPYRFALVLAATFAAAPSLAAEPDHSAAVVRDVEACHAIKADAERLACYDRAVGVLSQAQQSGAVVVLDKAQIQDAKKDAFGFIMPSFKFFDHGATTEAVDEVMLTVETAYRNGEGKWVLRTTSGQVWHALDVVDLFKDPRKGSQLRVKRGILNSYSINVDGQRSFKAHRDE